MHRDELLKLAGADNDPEVLTLCEYVHGMDVHGTKPGFRRPDVPLTQPAVISSASCPGEARRAVGRQRRRGRKDGAMVVEPKVRVAWSPRGNPAQMRLLKCQVFEIFFGGARGGVEIKSEGEADTRLLATSGKSNG